MGVRWFCWSFSSIVLAILGSKFCFLDNCECWIIKIKLKKKRKEKDRRQGRFTLLGSFGIELYRIPVYRQKNIDKYRNTGIFHGKLSPVKTNWNRALSVFFWPPAVPRVSQYRTPNNGDRWGSQTITQPIRFLVRDFFFFFDTTITGYTVGQLTKLSCQHETKYLYSNSMLIICWFVTKRFNIFRSKEKVGKK